MTKNPVLNTTPVAHTPEGWNPDIVVSDNHIYFYQDVSPKSVLDLGVALRNMNIHLPATTRELGLKETPSIHLHINSGGGCAFSGLAAASHILQSQLPVITYVEGQAASAASIMSCVGSKRYITEHSFMLIHQVSSGVWGTYQRIRDEKESLDSIMEMLEGIYLKYTHMKKKQLKEILRRDLNLNPTKCKELGLVDDILKYSRD